MLYSVELYSIGMRDVKSAAGSLRAERAAGTRRRIEDAARARFVRDGYAATTLREIADEAGVAVQTVYAVYGSKTNVVRALVRRLRDDLPADTAFRDALAASTIDEALATFTRSGCAGRLGTTSSRSTPMPPPPITRSGPRPRRL